IYEGATPYQVTLKQSGIEEGQPIDLSAFQVPAASTEGPPSFVSLDGLLTAEETEVVAQIPHQSAERAITLKAFGEAEDFENSMLAVADAEKAKLAEGFEISTGGENSDQEAFFAEIGVLFLVVILLVYLVIAFQFKSFSLPFLVLLAVYLGISGAILGLFITQTPLSFLGVMGIVSLTGIVVRNAVVLI